MYKKTLFYILFLLMAFALTVDVYAAELHDPTQPPWVYFGSAARQYGDLMLKAIVIKHNRKEVLIGDQYYKVGDIVMGAKIIDINDAMIKLRNESGVFSVYMFSPLDKKLVKGE